MPRRTAASSPAGPQPAGSLADAGPRKPRSQRPDYRVEALAKGLRILSLFDEKRPTWRVSDLAAAAGLPMPTVYRVVMTLTPRATSTTCPTATTGRASAR